MGGKPGQRRISPVGSCGSNVSQPNWAIFDLDPGSEASFADVLQATLRLRDALEQLGLHSYPKTSGGRGLHVYLPPVPRYSFDKVRAWVKALAEQLAAAQEDMYEATMGILVAGHRLCVDSAQSPHRN